MILSVIIATFNRSKNLIDVLDSLQKNSVPPTVSWEVVVVDNNSTDSTRDVVSDCQRHGALPVRYLFEGRQGKSIALNTGIKESHGSILAFTDDDCIVDDRWIASIVKEFETDPTLAGIGGRVGLYNKNDMPTTIRTMEEHIPLGCASFDQIFALIVGCNMAFKRSVFDTVGGFDPYLGPGTKALTTEDPDFVYRVYRQGFRLQYTPDVFVYHNHGRRTNTQIRDLTNGYYRGRGAFYYKHILRGDRQILRMAYWEISWTVKALVRNILAGRQIEPQKRLLQNLISGGVAYAYGTRAE